MKRLAIAGLALALTAGSALALDAASQIKARQDGMKGIGGATKGIYDTLSGDKDAAKLKAYAARINSLAPQVPGWFPAGTGPEAGVKTEAKAAIWSDKADFNAKAQAFATQAAKLNAAAETGDANAVKTEFMALRGTCKSCHDKFKDD
ncbi:MAG: cytochrome c [Caulobacter sp.]|nr:cytochrome c [Caulobacter sp.]